MINLLAVVDNEFIFFVGNLRLFVSWILIQVKETNERWRLSFISMLRLISTCAIVVASLLVGWNPQWIAVFDNLIDISKRKENHYVDRQELKIWKQIRKLLIRFLQFCDIWFIFVLNYVLKNSNCNAMRKDVLTSLAWSFENHLEQLRFKIR